MFDRLDILEFMKFRLTQKGYNYKDITYINAQIELLNLLIKKEAFNVLDELLKTKSYIRLLKKIYSGHRHLIDINMNPQDWKICNISEHLDEWLDTNSLIFSNERKQQYAFTKNDYGMQYISNKWQ
jgi:hypothetical protein